MCFYSPYQIPPSPSRFFYFLITTFFHLIMLQFKPFPFMYTTFQPITWLYQKPLLYLSHIFLLIFYMPSVICYVFHYFCAHFRSSIIMHPLYSHLVHCISFHTSFTKCTPTHVTHLFLHSHTYDYLETPFQPCSKKIISVYATHSNSIHLSHIYVILVTVIIFHNSLTASYLFA